MDQQGGKKGVQNYFLKRFFFKVCHLMQHDLKFTQTWPKAKYKQGPNLAQTERNTNNKGHKLGKTQTTTQTIKKTNWAKPKLKHKQ